jgi:hypothetical protein
MARNFPCAMPATTTSPFKRSILNEQSCQHTLGFIHLGFDDRADHFTVGVRFDVECYLRRAKCLRADRQCPVLFRRDRNTIVLPPQSSGTSSCFGKLLFNTVWVGIGFIDLVQCHHDRNARALAWAMASRVWGITPSSAATTKHHNIRTLRTTRTHLRERRVTGGIEEGDETPLLFNLIRADMLGNSACFACRYFCLTDRVQQLVLP